MNARIPGRRRGQALTEFALILPILLLLVFGVFDFGRAIYAYNSISNAAREGARTAIVDQSQTGGVYTAAQDAANQATALGLNPADPNDVLVSFPNTTGLCGTPAIGCIARVRVQYRFTAITPILGAVVGPITLSATTELPIESTNP
jgi:Flp pilus assembly protein TadG